MEKQHYTSHFYYFFFQAEDCIRDIGMTGVQTCALPISGRQLYDGPGHRRLLGHLASRRRRAAGPLGRAGQHTGPALGDLTMTGVDVDGVAAWLRACAE